VTLFTHTVVCMLALGRAGILSYVLCVTHAGPAEPIFVEVMVSNPLHLEVRLKQVQLRCRYIPPEDGAAGAEQDSSEPLVCPAKSILLAGGAVRPVSCDMSAITLMLVGVVKIFAMLLFPGSTGADLPSSWHSAN